MDENKKLTGATNTVALCGVLNFTKATGIDSGKGIILPETVEKKVFKT